MLSLKDLTSNANDLVNHGVDLSSSNPFPGARGAGSFDGTDYMSFLDSAALSMSANVTIEARIKMAVTGVRRGILIKGTLASDLSYYLETNILNGVRIGISTDGVTSVNSDSTSGLTNTNWHHVAGGVRGSDGQVKIWTDGAPISTSSFGGAKSIFNSPSGGAIGAQDSPTTASWNGLLAEIRVWNTYRSDAEILANYQSVLTGSETGLVGYWRLNSTIRGGGIF